MLVHLVLAPLLAVAAPFAPQPSLVLPGSQGQVVLAHGVLTAPQSADLTLAARRFVLERRAELGLPFDSALGAPRAYSTRFGGTVHLPQLVGGVPLHGASAVVTFDEQRRVVRLASSLSRYARAVMAWNVSRERALQLASQQVEGSLLQPGGAPYGGTAAWAFKVGDEVHAGYLVHVYTLKVAENWYLAIDATDGTVLWSENRVHHGFGANVYDPNPSGDVSATAPTNATLNHLPDEGDGGPGNDGGFLNGTQVRAFNCCPTLNCSLDAGAPARRATGAFQTGMGSFTYDMAICDRRQLATNDPAVHASADYAYAPIDPPTTARPSNTSRADFDEFAEVQAYFHVNKVYDFIKALSLGPLSTDGGFSPFTLRDQKRGKVAAVWVNSSEPDFQTSTQTSTGLVGNDLVRVDNAMFLPLENMQVVSVPEYAFDTDALVIYQGDHADFAYDAPVVWHEFGHGVVYSTSNWATKVAFDSRSANNESSALHEGSADVVAFMLGNRSAIGTYISPRSTDPMGSLRDANNSFKCPDVLQGEAHQDSMHYSGAIWEARSGFFAGTDHGATFDAAFYAALVSFPQDVDFTKAAAIIAHAVGQAFPAMPDAESKMTGIFTARGVTGCSKVLDVTNDPTPRKYYGIAGSTFAEVNTGALVPGPYQFKVHAPKGAKSVTISGPYFTFNGGTVRVSLLAKANAPITFTRNGSTLTNDADATVVPTLDQQGQMKGTAMVDVPCGGDVHFTVANSSQRDRTLQDLAFSFEPADACPVPDAGPPDAGPGEVDLTSVPDPLGPRVKGCGCSAGMSEAGMLLLLALSRWKRRRG